MRWTHYRCPFCGYDDSNQRLLAEHIEAVHGRERRVKWEASI